MTRLRGQLCLFAILTLLILLPVSKSASPSYSPLTASAVMNHQMGSPMPFPGLGNYSFSFTESGLPAGNLWTINLNGTIESSTNGSINFYNLRSGNYSWAASNSNTSNTRIRYAPSTLNGTIQVPSQNTTKISYDIQYLLSTGVSPKAGGTASPASTWFRPGSRVAISVEISMGYVFSNWTGSGSGSYSGAIEESMVTMSGPIAETANVIPVYGVIFGVQGLPQGITWFVTFNGHTQNSTSNSIAFVARGNGTFDWSVPSQIQGASGVQYIPTNAFGSVSLPAAASSGAANIPIQYTSQYYVSISTSNGGGSVTPKSGWYAAGYNLPIFATTGDGFNFSGWQVSNSSSSLPVSVGNSSTEIVVTVNGPGSVIALFTQNPAHGEAQSNSPDLFYAMTHNPALANPYVQLGGVSSIVVIILAGVYLSIKRSFGRE